MKLDKVLAALLLPNIAWAGGGGGGGIILGMLIFMPLVGWGLFRIWKFWFRMIFGGFQQAGEKTLANVNSTPSTKDCPYCAEPIALKAQKCKHCGSNLHP